MRIVTSPPAFLEVGGLSILCLQSFFEGPRKALTKLLQSSLLHQGLLLDLI